MKSVIAPSVKARYWGLRERALELLDKTQQTLAQKIQIVELWFRALTKPVAQVDGVKVKLGFHLSGEIRQSIWRGEYEAPECRMVLAKLCKEDVVMELGAGIGFLSTLCAKKIGSARVFTYEANPALVPYIRETFALNGVAPTLKNCLVGDHEGETLFYVHKHFWASSTLPIKGAKPVTLKMIDIDQELRTIHPTFLIIDIEGGEYDLFQHINLSGVNKVAIETHPWILGQDKVDFIKAVLVKNGFALVEKLSTKRHFFFER